MPHEEYEVESQDLEGTWRVIYWQQNGQERSAERTVGGLRFRFTKDRELTLVGKSQALLCEWFYRRDPGRSPAAIDYFKTRAPGAWPFCRAIYRLRGDRLTLCGDPTGDRPRVFAARAGTSAYLFELVREK